MSATATVTRAYKVLTASQMAQFQGDGRFTGAPVDVDDGYIHLSDLQQLTGTVDRHFEGQDNLFVVAIDLDAVGAAVRWEPSRGGALFPHVYGDLAWAAVLAFEPLRRNTDGSVAVPA